jgi:hypothetical protein
VLQVPARHSLKPFPLPFLLLAACLFLSVGCASLAPKPVTVGQIVQMSQEGVPAQEIIDKMRKSQTVYRLKASQLAKLKEEGVAVAVIDYMQQTYLDAVREKQALEDWSHWNLLEDGYWYGGPYWGGPYW